MADGRLAGRVALITGGSRGIGAAIAKAFAREGAQVAFTYHRRADAAHEVVAAIEAQGGEALAIQADASQADDAQRAVDETVARFGRINILVNNAGAIGGEYTVQRHASRGMGQADRHRSAWGLPGHEVRSATHADRSGGQDHQHQLGTLDQGTTRLRLTTVQPRVASTASRVLCSGRLGPTSA